MSRALDAHREGDCGSPCVYCDREDAYEVTNIEPCPECKAGKHGNCDGLTWDVASDEEALCPCEERGRAS